MRNRLPDGTTTTSDTKYVKTWRELAAPIEKELGWRLFAFDPGLSFQTGKNSTVSIPVELAEWIKTAIELIINQENTNNKLLNQIENNFKNEANVR